MTTQLPSREDVNNALFRLTTPLRGIIEKDSTALMDKVALEKIAAHLTQITNAYCALLAAHEQEPVGHVIQQLRGYENPTYVVQMTNEPEDGDEVFSHPAPVPAVPECFERLLAHAQGIAMGVDWNKGTAATHHRDKLCQAVKDCAAMLNGSKS